VIAVSIVVDFLRSARRSSTRVAAETGSEALEADALHFGSRPLASVAVLSASSRSRSATPSADAARRRSLRCSSASPAGGSARRTIDTLTDTRTGGRRRPDQGDHRRRSPGVGSVVAFGFRGRRAGTLSVDLAVAVRPHAPLDASRSDQGAGSTPRRAR